MHRPYKPSRLPKRHCLGDDFTCFYHTNKQRNYSENTKKLKYFSPKTLIAILDISDSFSPCSLANCVRYSSRLCMRLVVSSDVLQSVALRPTCSRNWPASVTATSHCNTIHVSLLMTCNMNDVCRNESFLRSGGVGGGVSFPGKKHYEGVRFNVISVTRGWVAAKFPGKKRYVTLEWPLIVSHVWCSM